MNSAILVLLKYWRYSCTVLPMVYSSPLLLHVMLAPINFYNIAL
uniref:Uncharacterized protein n=1 Tax=Rhizophora mucronata TaxID=61149 RepID=A0A2P2P029_RHIMU